MLPKRPSVKSFTKRRIPVLAVDDQRDIIVSRCLLCRSLSHFVLLQNITPRRHHALLSSDMVGGFAVGANLLLALILAPNFQKMNGMGASTAATQPSSVPAQLTPRAENMYMEKRGKMAPARDRRKVFAAMAEAALWKVVRRDHEEGEVREGFGDQLDGWTYNMR